MRKAGLFFGSVALIFIFVSATFAQDLPTVPGRIAYVSTDYNIFTVAPQLADDTALTTDAGMADNSARFYQMPTWSTDGRLAYFPSLVERSGSFTTEVFISPDGITPGVSSFVADNQDITYAIGHLRTVVQTQTAAIWRCCSVSKVASRRVSALRMARRPAVSPGQARRFTTAGVQTARRCSGSAATALRNLRHKRKPGYRNARRKPPARCLPRRGRPSMIVCSSLYSTDKLPIWWSHRTIARRHWLLSKQTRSGFPGRLTANMSPTSTVRDRCWSSTRLPVNGRAQPGQRRTRLFLVAGQESCRLRHCSVNTAGIVQCLCAFHCQISRADASSLPGLAWSVLDVADGANRQLWLIHPDSGDDLPADLFRPVCPEPPYLVAGQQRDRLQRDHAGGTSGDQPAGYDSRDCCAAGHRRWLIGIWSFN